MLQQNTFGNYKDIRQKIHDVVHVCDFEIHQYGDGIKI
jgi:hypothetical protein